MPAQRPSARSFAASPPAPGCGLRPYPGYLVPLTAENFNLKTENSVLNDFDQQIPHE
jgi:hypothetical protein